jgi:predicted enzyme related to lactoylglutathione lyase
MQHTLAVVAVSDMDQAADWYERLFGCPPTNRPMPTLVEWQVTSSGWLQVTADKHRAGYSQVNFAVDDLQGRLSDVAGRGLVPGDVVDVNKGVQLSSITDPDGNVVTFIGGFRTAY